MTTSQRIKSLKAKIYHLPTQDVPRQQHTILACPKIAGTKYKHVIIFFNNLLLTRCLAPLIADDLARLVNKNSRQNQPSAIERWMLIK